MNETLDMYPKVSIIVPNYNYADYLEERMSSILNQTYKNYEIIILDDRSSDNSREIIEKYRNCTSVSKIVYNEENSGSAFKQWRKGIDLASGELVWIAESDDFCDNNMLYELVEAFVSDPKCVLAFCKSELVDAGGRSQGEHPFQQNLTSSFIMGGEYIARDFIKEIM